MAETAIEWATHVFNPFTGCDVVTAGCRNCYAKTAAESLKRREQGRIDKARREGKPDPKVRYQRDGDPKSSGPGFGFTIHWDKLKGNPGFPPGARVFVNSMSDVFHPDATWDALVQLWALFARQPRVEWLVLTKRPERMREVLSRDQFKLDVGRMATRETLLPVEFPLPNVWLGTSIENRHVVKRADHLRATPAAVRFISAEPLLGPLMFDESPIPMQGGPEDNDLIPEWSDGRDLPELNLDRIDWLIAGGESGSNYRPLDLQWMRDLRHACTEAGTAYFVKQLGGARAGDALEDLPEDLRIREFPTASLAGAH